MSMKEIPESGYVKNVVGEWEKLFVMPPATEEQVSETLDEAYVIIENGNFRKVNDLQVENFEEGTTSVFSIGDGTVALLKRLIADSGSR